MKSIDNTRTSRALSELQQQQQKKKKERKIKQRMEVGVLGKMSFHGNKKTQLVN